MKTKIFSILLFLSCIPALAQVDTAWVRRYDGPINSADEAHAISADDSGNVYVTGLSFGSGTESDYTTIKYYPNGDTSWVRRYNGPGNSFDLARAIAVDDSGNVYLTGHSFGGLTSYDFATIKYYPNGDTAWVRRYNGPGNNDEEEPSLAVDATGNVYVTGRSADAVSGYDYATVKYYPNGISAWVKRYNGPSNSEDTPTGVAVDNSGNVYVTGYSVGNGTSFDYATIKYDSNGDTAWVRRYNGPGNGQDGTSGVAVDNSGNVYVTGYSMGTGTHFDYATIKYYPSGNTAWVKRYNGTESDVDLARAIAVDNSGNVYVTGYSVYGYLYDYGVALYDYCTIKYYPNGDTAWVRKYKAPGNSDNYAFAMALDDFSNAYVTGYSVGSGTSFDYATIKYNSNGDTSWVRRYSGPGSYVDLARAIAVDGSGYVYVTGESYGGSSERDYTTIKYVQYTCLAKPGDATGDDKVLLPDIVAIINFLFRAHPAPSPLCRGDANADGNVLLPDIVYLINFLFKSGPEPIKSKECCL